MSGVEILLLFAGCTLPAAQPTVAPTHAVHSAHPIHAVSVRLNKRRVCPMRDAPLSGPFVSAVLE